MSLLRGFRCAGTCACLILLAAQQLAFAAVLTPESAAAQQFPAANGTPSPAPAQSTAGLIPPATSPSPQAVEPAPAVVQPAPAVVSPSPTPTAPATAPQPAAAGPSPGTPLQPFNSIVSCVPFNILVTAGPDAKYTVNTEYAPEVEAAVLFKVEDQTLYVGFNKSYETTEAIKVTISMPASQLNGIINTGVGDIIANPGFKTAYTIVTNQGTGRIFARGITTNQLRIYAKGTGDVFAKGQIKVANITAQGTGSVTVSGVDKVVGDLQGIANVFLDPTSDAAPIDLNAQGISKVYYTRGQCNAASQLNIDVPFFSMNMGLSGCTQVKPSAFPRYKAFWTCGTRVRGRAVCTASAKAARAAASEGGDISVSSATSTNGNGQATATAGDGTAEPFVTVHSSGGAPDTAPAADTAAAQQAADAASVDITQAGRRLRHAAQHTAGRNLKNLVLPEIKLPSHMHPFPFVTVSSSSDDANDDDEYTATSYGDGSSASSSSSSGGGGHVAVASIECTVPVEQLYIPSA